MQVSNFPSPHHSFGYLSCLERHEATKLVAGISLLRLLAPTGARARSIHTATGDLGASIVVVQADGLEQIHGNLEVELDDSADNDRADNKGEEDDQKNKIENGVADDTTLPQLRLLQRIDRRPNLTTIRS